MPRGRGKKGGAKLSHRAAKLAGEVIDAQWSVDEGVPAHARKQWLLEQVRARLKLMRVDEAYSEKKLVDALQNRVYKAQVASRDSKPASWAPGRRTERRKKQREQQQQGCHVEAYGSHTGQDYCGASAYATTGTSTSTAYAYSCGGGTTFDPTDPGAYSCGGGGGGGGGGYGAQYSYGASTSTGTGTGAVERCSSGMSCGSAGSTPSCGSVGSWCAELQQHGDSLPACGGDYTYDYTSGHNSGWDEYAGAA